MPLERTFYFARTSLFNTVKMATAIQLLLPSSSCLQSLPIIKPVRWVILFYSDLSEMQIETISLSLPKKPTLNWITVSFQLLHFGDASKDVWKRIVANISQNVGESKGLPCGVFGEWAAALTSSLHSY